jgi:flagellar hook-associated protein 3 FlgL
MNELYKELQNAGLFMDIGMGIRSESSPPSPSGAPYIDRSSVFTYTLPGISVTGVGTTTMSDGSIVSNNLFDLLGAIAANFESDFSDGKGGTDIPYTYERADELFGILEKREITVQYSITDVGTKMHYLDFISDSMETRELDDIEQQQEVEGADPAESIIYYSAQMVSYQAALQMGTKVIPMSIFDYMS